MHRWLVAIRTLGAISLAVTGMAGCSSSGPAAAADTAAPTCAQTSCVPGASCRLPGGGTCQCFDAGEWSCSNAAAGGTTSDGGFSLDTRPPPDSSFTGTPPPADGGKGRKYFYGVSEGGCSSLAARCTDSTDVEAARTWIRSAMSTCGLSCTKLLFETTPVEGCAQMAEIDVEWVDGGFACLVKNLGDFRWPCTTLFEAQTSGCPK